MESLKEKIKTSIGHFRDFKELIASSSFPYIYDNIRVLSIISGILLTLTMIYTNIKGKY